MSNSTNNLDFTFDALDKRVIQISAKLMTAGDRLIYARMVNEFKLWKDSPAGYTPVNTSLAVVGCYADESSVRKSLKRLESLGLIVKLLSKPRQACRYVVRSIDEAMGVNPGLLSLPDMSERRATGMQLEKKGYSHAGKFRKNDSDYGSQTCSDKTEADPATVLTTPDYGSETCTTTVLRPVDYGSETSHERTHKEQEKELKRKESEEEIVNIESQGQELSRDDDLHSPNVRIVEDGSDQIMSTEEEESKPVVTEVVSSQGDDYFEPESKTDSTIDDDEDYFESDDTTDLIDDEDIHRREKRSEERNNQITKHFSTQQQSTAPTREDYLNMMGANRVKQYKHNPAKPAWM